LFPYTTLFRSLQVLEEYEVAAAVDVVTTALVAGHLHIRELDVVDLARRRDLQKWHVGHEANLSRPLTRLNSSGRSSSQAAITGARVVAAISRGAYAATAKL